MSTEESKVIDMFARKKPSEEEQTKSFDFEDIKKANAAKADKLARERRQHNNKVKKEYQIKPKK